jgi:uncharacterized protein (TIGR02647 family)|tara:strand:+ start:21897 stop:22130 length:234 start_codon:yes stop_codon:yes gene_type:complete
MDFNKIIEEIKLLNQFNLNSKSYGIKIHQSDASPKTVSAAARLFEKGLIDHIDGGYLTDLGVETAEHAQILLQILED